MPENLFTPRRFRRRHLVYCALTALTMEGSVVGVAQIWPQARTVPEQPIITVNEGPFDDVQAPFAPPGAPEPTPDEPTPPPEPEPTPEDTPPLEAEPEMVLDTPRPSPSVARPPRSTHPTGAIPPNAPGGNRPQAGVPGGVSSAVRTSGPLPAGKGGTWHVSSKPPYPAQARASHVTGSGTIRLTTDASGQIVSAAVSQSSGSAILDSSIVGYAKLNWSGPPSAGITVPFTFRLP